MVAELLTQVMDESIEKKIEFILYVVYYVNEECIGSYILSGTLNVRFSTPSTVLSSSIFLN